MPYRMVYEEPPKDPSLPVITELPEGYKEPELRWAGYREARHEARPYGMKVYYHCPHCKGWLEGHPNGYGVNTLDTSRLAGRRGTEYFCKRCGWEVGFSGIMS